MLLWCDTPLEVMYLPWTATICRRFQAEVGNPKWQSLWEFLTLLLCLMTWGHHSVTESILILGDNIASLSDALSMKGKGVMNAVARELSWRKIAFRWHFRVAHFPSELNVWADDLSRIYADPAHNFPVALAICHKRAAPSLDVMWQAWVGNSPTKFRSGSE